MLLLNTASALQEINDEHLFNLYEELEHSINAVKELIRNRLIKQQQEEAARRKEEEERKAEKERLQKQRELEEKLEKERKAREYEEKLSLEKKARSLEINRLTALVTRKKDNQQKILDYLRMKGIRKFYHFTDEKNLFYIKKFGGLYSWEYSEKHNIRIPNSGGDNLSRRLDRRHGLGDFVRLSFCNDHPMAYRKHKEGGSLVLLYIDIEVASFLETLFADRNAASNSFSCGDNIEDLQKINISATQRNYVSKSEGEIFSLHQAECMVKTFVPLKYIINIDNPEIMNFGQ